MLLSIGMIVKNEEKYLDRCLAALKPILDNIDSELIIADTGSTDNTVEIAKKYTDNVFYFEWINDFAAARNSTLEKAKGEWFMFCDADEIFQSCKNIIAFFKSGDYKKVETAGYRIRNYSVTDMSKGYTDSWGIRLAKITPELKFEGAIHEHYSTKRNKLARLEDVADHFGYAYDTEEDKDAKFKRNSDILLKVLEKEKEPSALLYFQAAQIFAMQKESTETLKYAELDIEAARREDSLSLISLLDERIKYYYYREDIENVIKYCEEYFNKEKLKFPDDCSTDADIYFYYGYGLVKAERYPEAVKAYQKYNELFRKIEKGMLNTLETLYAPLNAAVKANSNFVAYQLTFACVEAGYADLAADYVKRIKPEPSDNALIAAKLKLEFRIMRLKNDYRRAEQLYRELGDETKIYFHILTHREIKAAADRERVTEIFAKIYKDDEIFKEIANPESTAYDDVKKETPFTVNVSISSGGAFLQYNAKKLVSSLKNGGDISEILLSENFNAPKTAEYCAENFGEFFEALPEYPAQAISAEGLSAALDFIEDCMNACLRGNLNIDRLFSLWGKVGLRVCEVNKLDPDKLSGRMFAAVMAAEVDFERAQRNYKECVSALTALVKQYQPAKKIVLSIRDSIQEEINSPAEGRTENDRSQSPREIFLRCAGLYRTGDANEKYCAFREISDNFLENRQEEMKARFDENLAALAEYPYQWGCPKQAADLPFVVFPVGENEYSLFYKSTETFSELFELETERAEKYFFENLDKQLFIEGETNYYHLCFLNDNVRRSEDYGKDNHIYLFYSSFDELAPLLMLRDIRPLLKDKKFVFLIGDDNRKKYPVNFLKQFGEDYQKTARPVGIDEVKRICFWYKHAYSGTILTTGVMGSNPYIQKEYGHDFHTYSKKRGETIYGDKEFRETMKDPETVFSAQRLDEIANSPDYSLNLDDFKEFIEWLRKQRPYPHEYTVNELFRGYFLFHYEKRGFNPRIVPVLLYDPHMWDTTVYDEIVLSFKYRSVLTCMRDPIMSFARCYIIGIAGWNQAQTEYLLASDYSHAQFLPEELLDEYYGIRFEDIKRFPEKVCRAICRHLNLPFDKAMTEAEVPMTDKYGHTTRGFDQTPLNWDISMVLSDFDKTRLQIFYEPIYKHYGYAGFDLNEYPLPREEALRLFSYPFRFEKLLYQNVSAEDIHQWVQNVLQNLYLTKTVSPKLIPLEDGEN